MLPCGPVLTCYHAISCSVCTRLALTKVTYPHQTSLVHISSKMSHLSIRMAGDSHDMPMCRNSVSVAAHHNAPPPPKPPRSPSPPSIPVQPLHPQAHTCPPACFPPAFAQLPDLLQDLMSWMKTHNALLTGPQGSLQEALFDVCGEVEEHQGAPQTVPGSVNTLCCHCCHH